MDRKKGYLVLESRNQSSEKIFDGFLFGAPPSTDGRSSDRGFGEIVFNTSMTGYQEILTDPSYYGQMVCMTYPHIGNTGINPEDFESKKAWPAGFLIHELCETPSNWRSTQSLESYLTENGVTGLLDIDTRELTRWIRSQGAIRAIIVDESELSQAQNILNSLPSFENRDLISEVTTSQPYFWDKPSKTQYKVIAMDFGVKHNILRSLCHRGCEIEIVPAQTSAEEILKKKPDGVFLSNGPGNPSAAPYAVNTVQNLLGKVPLFGICMGHQILSLALGGKTFKMKFGHRGANQHVLNHKREKVEITSQNHGYAVDPQSLSPKIQITHTHLNDGTLSGIEDKNLKAFSVQYHPEACPGPHDSQNLFDQFIEYMS
ncbi:MAG: carbamoyl phosphate synthase small subunit [Bdellovibrionaceae bacterium]|nr:carbamoyl phosphate synthase small subunit [Pseudobdellovibrionaceae bacterium]